MVVFEKGEKMKQVLVLLIFILVTACGTQPLTQPENDTLVEAVKLTATPTVEPDISSLPTVTKTSTPHVRFAYPTPGTPISLTVAVVKPEQAANGYTFSEARLVPDTLGVRLELIDWHPDDPHQVLIVRDEKSLEAIDINTGERHLYSDGTTRVRHPVWLPARQAVAYLTFDENDYNIQYVWISDGEKTELVFTTSWVSPLAVTLDGNGLILFDANWRLTQVGALDSQLVKLTTDTQKYVPLGYNQGGTYQVAQSPDRQKALYFNGSYWLILWRGV